LKDYKNKIHKVFLDYLKNENNDLNEQTILRDVDLDDLDFLEIKMRLEKLFSIKIEESSFLEKQNLKEINLLLYKLLIH
jgi:acyl carrier protein